jgi:peptidoglycan/xylan/chitin deacetylase (PgdA/CDA1 family)
VAAVKAVVQQSVKASAAAVDLVRRPRTGIVVLIYHRVGGESGVAVDLPLAQFEEQIAWLASAGRVCALGDALPIVAGRDGAGTPSGPASAQKIVVTFDDGTADFAEHALPVLVRYRVPVTLYVATAFLDEQREFPDAGRPLSWNALRDACTTGLVDVGSHTHRHTLLDRVPEDHVDDELDRSIASIGDRLGAAPRDFAYPKAVLGSAVAERAVRARFRSAAVAGSRPNPPGATDVYRLSRTPLQVADRTRWFVRKASGGMAFEDDLRRLLNRARYTGRTT